MLKNGKNAPNKLHNNGCSCCNTKQERRVVRKIARLKEKLRWKRDQQLDKD